MRFDILQQMFDGVFNQPITHADIARELRNVLRNDPMKAERAIGYMYGYAFKMAESLYEMRGSRGRQVWR